jgi:hypothetical protein
MVVCGYIPCTGAILRIPRMRCASHSTTTSAPLPPTPRLQPFLDPVDRPAQPIQFYRVLPLGAGEDQLLTCVLDLGINLEPNQPNGLV